MGKRFYIVVPYKPGKDAKRGFVSQIGSVLSPAKVITLSEKIFSDYKEKIQVRVDKVVGSLSGIGVTAAPLDTQNLIELYYSSYNPELSQIEKLPDEKNKR